MNKARTSEASGQQRHTAANPAAQQPSAAPLEVRLLGPLRIALGERVVALPASRKVRALLAYLCLAPKPMARSPLCELLWDIPNDPRGELRWCLSKIRGLFDEGERWRVQTREDTVALDLSGCLVDALEVARAVEAGVQTLAPERLRALCALFKGDFLEGLEIERSSAFMAWLSAQRRRFHSCHTALLEQLVKRGDEQDAPAAKPADSAPAAKPADSAPAAKPADSASAYLERWLELAPFDQQAHEILLKKLARRGHIREGEAHLEATIKLFEQEGLDSTPVRNAWRTARSTPVITIHAPPQPAPATAPSRGRASIAVMPLTDSSSTARIRGGAADALAHDVITRLAKLRSLFVIAQGSVFALHERSVGAEEAGRMLNVDYVMSGSIRTTADRLSVSVELAETRSARIVWAETYNHKLDDAFLMLDSIGDRIVASIASEIETLERNRAILKPPNSLDAWEAHHRGLWHMHRYRKEDNDQAQHFFRTALELDPTFSRAYAGLSFTHFQNVFQNWGQREAEIEHAYAAAAQGLMADERDPAVHWAMGRVLWLREEHDECVSELTRSIELSPNFALGHYNLSFVHSIVGDASAAINCSDYSRQLSPFDPMLFGMFGTRALALVRLERFEEAAEWAVKAAARPNAFPHIHVLAACCLALIGALDQARAHVTNARKNWPNYRLADLFTAFPFDAKGRALFSKGAALVGLT